MNKDPKFWKDFAEETIATVMQAQQEAFRLGYGYYCGTEGLLTGLAIRQPGRIAKVLASAGIEKATIQRLFKEMHRTGKEAEMSTRCMLTLERAKSIAEGKTIHPEHLLLAILENKEGGSHDMLTQLSVDRAMLKQDLEKIINE